MELSHKNDYYLNITISSIVGVIFLIFLIYFFGSEVLNIWDKMSHNSIHLAFVTILVVKCLSFIGWYLAIERHKADLPFKVILVYGYATTIAINIVILDYLIYPEFRVSALYALLVPFGWFVASKNGTLIAAFWAVCLSILSFLWLTKAHNFEMFVLNRITSVVVIVMLAVFLRYFKIVKVKLRETNKILNQHIIEIELQGKELEQFVYTVSHDLKEPLRSLSVILDIFREGNKELLKEEDIELLSLVKQSTQKMGSSIQSMLDYSKLGQDFHIEEVSINKLVYDVIFELEDVVKKVEVDFDIQELGKLNVYLIDFHLLIAQLIKNAVHYRKQDQALKISISRTDDDHFAAFHFTDNGIGIEEINHERIFKIFQSLENHDKRKGIGLAHCSKIVQLHNGSISVKSQLGMGSTFIVRISKDLEVN